VLRDEDSINRTADAGDRRERRERRASKGESNTEERMLAVFIVLRMPSRRRGAEYCESGIPDGVAETWE
jgi:hypothetical protein